MANMAKALFSDPDKKIVIEDVDLPKLTENSVRVRTAFSYISAGTELTSVQMGKTNFVGDVSRGQLGYSMSGTVTEVGSNVTHVKAGEQVACVGAGAFHATEVIVAKNLVTPLPKGVSLKAAAPAAMMCFAMEGVRKAAIQFGENVLVVGAGMMGQIASQLALACGGQIFITDINTHRLSKVSDGITIIAADDDGWKSLEQATAPTGLETVIVCIGGEMTELYNRIKEHMCKSPDGIPQGRIVFPGGATVTIPFASAAGNIQFLSSAKAGPGYRDEAFESGGDYPAGYVKWTVKRNVQVLMNAIAEGKLAIEPLITSTVPFNDALSAYKELATAGTKSLAILLEY